jgi:putative tricarboxylic transport membrane protein
LILGPIAESNLRRSLQLSDGSLDIFYTSPLAMTILGLAVISLFTPFIIERINRG